MKRIAQFLNPITVGAVAVALFAGCGMNGTVTAAAEEGSEDKMVTVRLMTDEGKIGEAVEVPRIVREPEEWQKLLSEEQCFILREKGTERAGTGELLQNKDSGYYLCAACKLPLYESSTKFESGTGWPSFFQPVAKENVTEIDDLSHGMVRTEVVCTRCGGHLGHVFPDGPQPTGMRYCMNSAALEFVKYENAKEYAEEVPVSDAKTKPDTKVGDRLPEPKKDIAKAGAPGEATAVFAGGCFWCTEAVFEEIKGVKNVVSGYSGGSADTANYQAVCNGDTGHAEAIKITYDPSQVTYGQLMRIFFATHNPTTKDRQGPDVGSQYRSAIFFADEEQKAVAEAYIKQLDEASAFSKSIVTTLEPLDAFYVAEDYHQDFAKSNPSHPYIRAWSDPKMKKVQESFGELLRSE